ncbi:hypothetical protein EDD63_101131 [Breznakia blatticola]|uniref:Uncharacterized protein n=1 Tax=Breznakia blatticola TaxID=1754012 RepID=A0A4R8A6X6_9FIRM|nr:DUF6323 family protein [Breznakia blatticola]TDW26416.1 hypothetical protein EDD63_101131 [Breznakia blatticola]
MRQNNIPSTTDFSLQLHDVNYEIAQAGHQLSNEDINKLIVCQKQSYTQFGLIDIHANIIFTIASKLAYSPYIRQVDFVDVIASFMNSYYAIRKYVRARLYDDELVALMYQHYLHNHGQLDSECIYQIIQTVRSSK